MCRHLLLGARGEWDRFLQIKPSDTDTCDCQQAVWVRSQPSDAWGGLPLNSSPPPSLALSYLLLLPCVCVYLSCLYSLTSTARKRCPSKILIWTACQQRELGAFQVEQSKVLIKEGGVQLTLTIVDTPGFGDAVDNSNW